MSNRHRKVKRSTIFRFLAGYRAFLGCAQCGITPDEAPLHFYWKVQDPADTKVAAVISSYCLRTIVEKLSRCDVFCHPCRRARALESQHRAGEILKATGRHFENIP